MYFQFSFVSCKLCLKVSLIYTENYKFYEIQQLSFTIYYTEHCSVWSYQFYRYYYYNCEDDSLFMHWMKKEDF